MNKLITEFYFFIGAVFSSILCYSDYVYNKSNVVTTMFTIYYTITYIVIRITTFLYKIMNTYINNAH